MRIIALRTLRLFWEQHADSRQALQAWYHDVKRANWKSPGDIKKELDLRKNFNLATEITEFTEKFLFFSVFPVSSVAKMN